MATKTQLEVLVCGMTDADMPGVVKIARASYDNPPSEDDFLDSLRRHNRLGYVAKTQKRGISGYVLLEGTRRSFHILDLAVHPDDRRSGVGLAIVQTLVQRMTATGRKKIVAEVRDRNLPAHLFFKSCGFRAVEVYREYCIGPNDELEDAYVFQWPGDLEPAS